MIRLNNIYKRNNFSNELREAATISYKSKRITGQPIFCNIIG
jgi:hypothetical protein